MNTPPPAGLDQYQFWLLMTPMLLTFGTALIAAIVGVINSSRISKQVTASKDQAAKIQEVHVLFNSRFTELLSLTAKSSHAEGVAAGTAAAAAEQMRAADPTGSKAGAAARTERAADADAAREIRADDFKQAQANAQVRDAAPQPITLPETHI